MELARNTLLGLHLLGTAGILVSLFFSRKKLSLGITHSALLSLISGMALVGLRYPLVEADPMKWEKIDNTKISVKLTVLIVILFITHKNKTKQINPLVVISLLALTSTNIYLALN
jgi:uncharacterized membrane protein